MPFPNDPLTSQASPQNPALELAMHDVAKNDNPQTRASLYKAILSSTLIVPGRISGGAEVRKGQWTADENSRLSLATIEHPPGHVVLPAFTAVEALTSWAGLEVQWIALGAQALFQSIAQGTIAEVRVNPFRPGQTVARPGGVITRQEFLALAQGLLPESNISDNVAQMKVGAGQKILIGSPAVEPPAELLAKLTACFRQIPELRGAYLFQMTNQNVTSTVIGLHFSTDPSAQQMQQIMARVGNIVRDRIQPGLSLDFMPLKSGSFLESVKNCAKALLDKQP
jgi:SseB protein N-terminal domain/SseB protein C-terminal domain